MVKLNKDNFIISGGKKWAEKKILKSPMCKCGRGKAIAKIQSKEKGFLERYNWLDVCIKCEEESMMEYFK